MHNWETMSQNFKQSWSGAIPNGIIKTETDLPFNNNNNTMVRNGESNPTSPRSIESEESIQPNLPYHDTLQQLISNGSWHRPLGFDPLTPPGYTNSFLPKCTDNGQETVMPTTPKRRFSTTENNFNSATLTPSHTPPMDQTPPKSPKFQSDSSEKDRIDFDNCSISGDETKSLYSDYNQEISVPRVNSHGKVKTHKCKHCDEVFITKKTFWEHSRQHIKPERLIECPTCSFVTEYKHHFEYHLRNHEGSKPFKCPECNYTCVNKSMLNSHLKSHSNVYQYRCENCSYATKYVHSLKLHLRKYQHEPSVPLDTDGQPDAIPIIDVYGTRRGPKKRSTKGKTAAKRAAAKAAAAAATAAASPAKTIKSPKISTPPPPPPPVAQLPKLQPQFSNIFQPSMMDPNTVFQNILHNFAQRMAQLSPNQFRNGHNDTDSEMRLMNGNIENTELEIPHPESPTSSVPNNNKLNDEHHQMDQSYDATMPENDNHIQTYDCKHCGISYQNDLLHTIHMGYHKFNEAFTCNSCGEKCTDAVSFNLHIINKAH